MELMNIPFTTITNKTTLQQYPKITVPPMPPAENVILQEINFTKMEDNPTRYFGTHSNDFCSIEPVFEDGCCVYGKSKKGYILISDAIIRIVKICTYYENENDSYPKTMFKLLVFSNRISPQYIDINAESYYTLPQLLRNQLVNISILEKNNLLVEYLRKVYLLSVDKAKQEQYYRYTGWHFFADGIRYVIGFDGAYSNYNIPLIERDSFFQVLHEGLSFLDVIKPQYAKTIFLHTHIAYALYWLQSSGISSAYKSTLFIEAMSQSLKSSVMRLLANPFLSDNGSRDGALTRGSSTLASIRTAMFLGQDQTICIDDVTLANENLAKRCADNVEYILRVIGDGRFDDYMDISKNSVWSNIYRGGVILTGESKAAGEFSSDARTTRIVIDRNTFDKEKLLQFQKTPYVLRNYFALYVQFLTEFGPHIHEKYSTGYFVECRKRYQYLEEPRFIDTMAGYHIISEIIRDFCTWAGADNKSAQLVAQNMSEAAEEVMQFNADSIRNNNPVFIFVKTIYEATYDFPIAESEDEYMQGNYNGFYKGNEIWIDPQKSYNFIQSKADYYQKIPPARTLHRLLHNYGLIRVQTTGRNTIEYTIRGGRRYGRPYMLVLLIPKIRKFLYNE